MLEQIGIIIASLAGLGGLISILVNIGKIVGLVKDGEAEKWVQILNLIAFVGVSAVYFAELPVDWGIVNEWMIYLAALFGFVVQIWGSKFTYSQTKGIPVIGYSYSK